VVELLVSVLDPVEVVLLDASVPAVVVVALVDVEALEVPVVVPVVADVLPVESLDVVPPVAPDAPAVDETPDTCVELDDDVALLELSCWKKLSRSEAKCWRSFCSVGLSPPPPD